MAQRRMFSNRIANSARFLQMPAESQLLYFHMVLRADDDGVVESYPLIKMLGLASDNFKVLLAKGFIQPLNEDQVIVIIDWTEHNSIRADRKINSIYLPLLKKKFPEIEILHPKPRIDVEDNSKRVDGLSTDGIGKDRIGKDSLNKVNKDNAKKHYSLISWGNPEINEVIEFLRNQLGGTPDGTITNNRRYAHLLLGKLKKDYPDKPSVVQVKALITYGLQDQFHGKNITSFEYLYRHCQQIIQSVKNQVNQKKGIKL